MKKLLLVAFSAILLFAASCDRMDSLYKPYLDEGQKVYLGKPDSVLVRSGYGCVMLVWTNNADSKIAKTRIVYNYGADTLLVSFQRKVPGFQRDSVRIDLEPGYYVFDIENLNSDGSLVSIPVTGLMGTSYGDTPRYNLVTRSFTTQITGDVLNISWGNVTSDFVYSIVRHTDGAGVVKEYVCPNNSFLTRIPDVRIGDKVEVSSGYRPEATFLGLLESFPIVKRVERRSVQVNGSGFGRPQLPFDNMTNHAGWCPFHNLFDDNTDSAWVSSLGDNNSANGQHLPLSFTIDLGSAVSLCRYVMYYHPALEYAWKSRSPKSFELWGTDTIKEGQPDAYWSTNEPDADWKKDWVKLADCVPDKPSGFDNPEVTPEDVKRIAEGFGYDVNPENRPIRYCRTVVTEIWDGTLAVTIGDIRLFAEQLSLIDE